MLTEGWALSPPISAVVDCAGSADTKHRISRFPIARVDKGDGIHRIDLRFPHVHLSCLLFLAVERSTSSSRPPPPPTVMVSDLPPSHYQSENDLRVLRKVIGWQSSGYDSKMRRGMMSLAHPSDFVYFSSYALVGLVPPLSTFFLVLLEHYELQLQHLSPHSIMLVAIFSHFCEMFVCVQPLVHLFLCFHVLRPVNKQPPRLGGYYFQHQTKGSSKYIAALSPGRWERWRDDWVLVQTDAHERLMLPTAAPMTLHVHWEQDSGLETIFNHVLGRIRILA
jgi:hypothetical protein